MSDLDDLAADLASSPERVMREIKQVVSKGALKIKDQLKKEAAGSQSFGRMAATINYELNATGNSVEAEIGPDKDVMTSRKKSSRYGPNSSPGSAASLAGIAYFGGSRGGGGTLPDPQLALDAEESSFISFLERLDGVILE